MMCAVWSLMTLNENVTKLQTWPKGQNRHTRPNSPKLDLKGDFGRKERWVGSCLSLVNPAGLIELDAAFHVSR